VQFTENKGIYVCPAFAGFVWQKHGFGSRQANPAASITLRQVHSNHVWNADRLADREQEGDALVAAEPSRSIGVRTADCVPILLLDERRHAVAAVHAGWRGTAASIAIRTVEKLRADFGSDPADLHTAIGPCIRACCYEVSPEVADRFATWPESVHRPKNAKPHVDLARANTAQLIAAGLAPTHIYDSNLCTSCQLEHFFSFRREPYNPGRMLSAICRI
jgi:polyphenol oxidase